MATAGMVLEVSGMFHCLYNIKHNIRNNFEMQYKQMKKVTYIPVNMDKVSTIFGTGSLEMCMTQLSINSFNFLKRVDFDEWLHKTHCQEF